MLDGNEMKSEVVWDKNIKAWVASDGRVVAPRRDEDGFDYFFVSDKDTAFADARYCKAEGYWAFGKEIAETKYKDLLYLIDEKIPSDLKSRSKKRWPKMENEMENRDIEIDAVGIENNAVRVWIRDRVHRRIP